MDSMKKCKKVFYENAKIRNLCVKDLKAVNISSETGNFKSLTVNGHK